MNMIKSPGLPANHTWMLACDIDGTLLRDGEPTSGLAELRRHLEEGPPTTRLIYATGRTYASVRALIHQGRLPPPDAVASQVGTELWLPPWREPLRRYADHIGECWDADVARAALRDLPGVTLQPAGFQTPYKASAFVSPVDAPAVQQAVRTVLGQEGIEARFVYSGQRFLDVLPARSGKRAAIRFLQGLWEGRPQVVACGDSGNDADMLADPATLGVIVGNARDVRLEPLRLRPRVYRAAREYAAGVLEGASLFGVFPQHPGCAPVTRIPPFKGKGEQPGGLAAGYPPAGTPRRSAHRSRATRGR
jgi:sucrose-6F-phosphate phosphohydrolase